MLKIAITGNIASGKSQVENFLKKSYPVYDTDKFAHEILDKLDGFYDYDVLTNGKIDRKKLGKLVFNNPDLKKKLEDIIHPKIRDKIENIFREHTDCDIVFISVPLLFEAGFENMFDKIILVTTDETTRLQRLMSRDNITQEDALKKINSQIPEDEKLEKSDIIIKNNGNIAALETEIQKALQKL